MNGKTELPSTSDRYRKCPVCQAETGKDCRRVDGTVMRGFHYMREPLRMPRIGSGCYCGSVKAFPKKTDCKRCRGYQIVWKDVMHCQHVFRMASRGDVCVKCKVQKGDEPREF